jgi:hypothetical protein
MSTPLLSRAVANRPRSFGSLLFTLVVSSSFVCTGLVATPAEEATGDRSAPPVYPDTAHVFNGCHLSTLAYLARFSTEFPAEQGRPVVVRMLNADGQTKPHTLALVTWHGAWWCRDEYFGVFSLQCPVTAEPNPARVVNRVERFYQQHARTCLRVPGTLRPTAAPESPSANERLHAVKTAAQILPFPHTIYWVRDGAREVPVVFFRPVRGQIAVYDPARGTAVAECASRDDAKIVAHAASLLGYRADAVRADFTAATGTLVANASSLSHSEVSQ